MNTFHDNRNNKTYKLILIGDQEWMAENFALESNDGCWAYNNDLKNVEKYGYLYTLKTAQLICPEGWRLPSDNDWMMLEKYLGMNESHLNVEGRRCPEIELKLHAENGWDDYNGIRGNGTNTSGFNALPGGIRANHADFGFQHIGSSGSWWTSTIGPSFFGISQAWTRSMFSSISGVQRTITPINTGLSVRFLRN